MPRINEEKKIIKIPAVALRGLTILPDTIIHFDLSRKKSIQAVEQAMINNQKVFLITQKDANMDDPDFERLYHMGTIAMIKQVTKLPNNIVRVLVDGETRATLHSIEKEITEYLLADVEIMQASITHFEENEEEAMIREMEDLFTQYKQYHPKTGKSLMQQFEHARKLGKLLDSIAINTPISYIEKQKVLETVDEKERYAYLSSVLYKEIEIAKIKTGLAEQIKAKVEKNQKEYILREQLGYIREELGENNTYSDSDQLETELKKLKASKEVKNKIQKEILRFKGISGNSSESSMQRAYIETLLEIPWDKASKDNLDIGRAQEILNEKHYGLEKVKERILEFLAVRCLTNEGESPIICLVGPPGTGKTSIARSMAAAINKKYVRISLGGVRDEAEIRGHRRTYVGAMPGRIVAGLKNAGVKNPLILLDEIDKMSSDYRGDTGAALLEVLDSEQNKKFKDHYIDISIDLSKVLFVATANSVETIPRPLLDRMELIEITSYTANEKFHISKEFLIQKQMKQNGLKETQLSISDHALENIIQFYTREAGVRDLERKIGTICRKTARKILQDNVTNIKVTSSNLKTFLGKERYNLDKANEEDEIGIVRGLAWTSVGGDTLQIEVNVMPGKGELELTGQLGDVMRESALTGMSYVRSVSNNYKISSDFFKEHDVHIHIPEGAVPKDGPSAGITMATALLSAVTKSPVRANVAMTGEITLRGRVLPIGGLKEKILAAKAAGIKTVLVPNENERDVSEISQEIKEGLDILFVTTMQEVISHAFTTKSKKNGMH